LALVGGRVRQRFGIVNGSTNADFRPFQLNARENYTA
jgi:hypothetical protein